MHWSIELESPDPPYLFDGAKNQTTSTIRATVRAIASATESPGTGKGDAIVFAVSKRLITVLSVTDGYTFGISWPSSVRIETVK